MKNKKNIVISLILIALTAGFAAAASNYRVEFIRWVNIPLTYICFAFTMIFPALSVFSLTFARSEYNGKKRKRALTAILSGFAIGAVSMVTSVIINNVIANGTDNVKAINTAIILSVITYLILLVRVTRKKPAQLISAILSALIILGIVFGKGIMEDNKNNSRVAAPTEVEIENWGIREDFSGKADFYISTDGDDKNDGSIKSPFLTFERAQEAVRTLDKTEKDKIVVGVFPGEYRTKGLTFTSEDSGTEECPIVYGVCGVGECVLNAGVSLNPADFESIRDEKVLSRLTEEAGNKVMSIDLSGYGITKDDYGKIYAIGSYNTASHYTGDYVGPIYSELFVNDKRQIFARYPNEGYLKMEKVISTGYGRETDGSLTARPDFDETVNPESDVYGISSQLARRIASWQTLDDVWMFAYWKYDWADASTPIGEFDAENKTLSPKFVSTYGTKVGAPYYFFNVFEELDSPGEWYLDRENALLYVYPDGDFSTAEIDLSLGLDSVITLENASYITFDGFTIKGTRGDGITISGDNNTVKCCLIKNVSGNAAVITGYNNLVSQCEITHTGKGCIYLDGGDRETLTPGNNRADNNLIHDWAEVYETYMPAVSLSGVGNICSHNEMYNTPHEAITYAGNNHLIEYNRIHDVNLLSDDAGAIYSGRRWDWYGTEIRYNMIYNLGADGHTPNGIYFDDALSGQTAYGNILINVPQCGFLLGGGRDLTVKNNILINCNNKPLAYDQRAIDGVFGGWFTHSSQEGGDMWKNLEESPWQNEYWQKAYPQMSEFSFDFSDTDNPDFIPNPSGSEISGNLIVNNKGYIGRIEEKAEQYSDVSGNAVYKDSLMNDIFTDYKNGDYTIKEDSPVFKDLPGFEQLPLSSMGRYSPKK